MAILNIACFSKAVIPCSRQAPLGLPNDRARLRSVYHCSWLTMAAPRPCKVCACRSSMYLALTKLPPHTAHGARLAIYVVTIKDYPHHHHRSRRLLCPCTTRCMRLSNPHVQVQQRAPLPYRKKRIVALQHRVHARDGHTPLHGSRRLRLLLIISSK